MSLDGRTPWTTLTLGSRLYGTAVEGSDEDLLNLYIPSTEELVANRQVKLPQCVKDGVDTRHLLLGDFVMSLGVNAEHMVLAYHYDEIFGDLQVHWLNGQALNNILDASFNMWENAKTPKNRAHAYRYTLATSEMSFGHRPLYPLDLALPAYMRLRNDEPDQLSDEDFKKLHAAVRSTVNGMWKSGPTPGDRKFRARWVMVRYLGL